MPLTPEDVLHIAELARIGISDAEARTIQGELNNIFEMIGRMQKVDTEGVAPMTHAGGAALRLREDKVTESDRHDLYQSVAPAVEGDLYLVPKVIE